MLQQLDIHAKRLLDLADFIEDLAPERFSMRQWGQLGEPRCICGWLLHRGGHDRMDDWEEGADHLGLDRPTSSALFSPENEWDNRHAARALRHLAITGELIP